MMEKDNMTFTVAAAQAAPVFLNRQATVEKACDLIAEAGRNKAQLIVLPEVFIPAYPDWVWVLPPSDRLLNDLYAELLDNAVTIPDDATEQICRAAKSAKIHVVIGVNERNTESSNASLYNTILYINS
jgi:nitrilase